MRAAAAAERAAAEAAARAPGALAARADAIAAVAQAVLPSLGGLGGWFAGGMAELLDLTGDGGEAPGDSDDLPALQESMEEDEPGAPTLGELREAVGGTLRTGQRIVFRRLTDHEQLNGHTAVVEEYDATAGHYIVVVDASGQKVVARRAAFDVLGDAACFFSEQPEMASSVRAEELGETYNVERKLATVLRLCAAGYLSKGYGQFKQAALQDPTTTDAEERTRLRSTMAGLHPQRPPVAAEVMADKPGTAPHYTTPEAFNEVFAKPPKERGMGTDAVSYEELQQMYHGGFIYLQEHPTLRRQQDQPRRGPPGRCRSLGRQPALRPREAGQGHAPHRRGRRAAPPRGPLHHARPRRSHGRGAHHHQAGRR